MEVRTDIPPLADQELLNAARRGLARAGEQVLLPAAVAGAPYEDGPAKHPEYGGHGRDLGYSRLVAAGPDGEAVEVGFSAFWLLWQHERLDYHHDHGRAKFLELAMVEQGERALEVATEQIRELTR